VAAEAFRFRRAGRNRATLWSAAAVWAVLAAAVIIVDASPMLMGLVGVLTLPAIWELATNPSAGLDLTQTDLHWFTGRRSGTLARGEIAQVRLDTRLDFSVRATVVLTTGRKIRLPYECTPPHKAFEAALNNLGIRTERHHFSLIG
jgi:hypothetical protein